MKYLAEWLAAIIWLFFTSKASIKAGQRPPHNEATGEQAKKQQGLQKQVAKTAPNWTAYGLAAA